MIHINISQWLIDYRYLVLFPLVIIEGPIVTLISGFLSSLGYLNILIVYVIVVIGDLVGDSIYYSFGRFGGRGFIKRWGRYIRVTDNEINNLEKSFSGKNTGRTLITGKLTHLVGSIVLIGAGITKLPYRKFIWFNFLATLLKSFILVIVGYYFGQAVIAFSKYLDYATIIATLAVIITLAVYIIFRRRKAVDKNN